MYTQIEFFFIGVERGVPLVYYGISISKEPATLTLEIEE